MPSLIKKRRSQEDTRAKLLAAALDIFAKSGYDAATTRNIAKKAGVNESLIHRYFKSKLGLFVALKHQFRENLLKQFLSYGECEHLEEELIRFMKARLHSSKRDKKFFKIAVSRAILDPKLRMDVKDYARMRPVELIERFEKFRHKGQIRNDADLDQVVGVLQALGFAFSIFMDAVECLPLSEVEKLMRTAATIVSEGLRPRE